ncbi:PAS domain-containing sensor histidine kinase [Oscillatoria amoena NRMC-F 0135]|nr:PAS domain-containing sensor histidine kinase [Oscillatoria amoena NRMC-F 0135]
MDRKFRVETGGGMDRFFQALVEQSGDVFTVVDRNFRIRYISSGVREFGAEPIALLGKSIFDFVCPEKIDEWKQYLAGAGERQLCEIGLRLMEDTITYFDVTIFRISQNQDEHGQVLKLHNITPKKVREKQLINSNKQLDQVIFKTTHDLRAPLMSAMGLVDLAVKAPVEQKDEYLELIRKSLFKLNGFIDEMNHFFRTEKMAVQREQVSLRELIAEELENQKNLYRAERLVIETAVEEKDIFYSDLIRIKTILTNLVTNAIKYADVTKEKSIIRIRATADNNQCELIVEDNGIGIGEEYQGKIFDLFFRATTQSHGTGLGLFILKDTVERLNGTIEMKSKLGVGTRFKICIPNQVAAIAVAG